MAALLLGGVIMCGAFYGLVFTTAGARWLAARIMTVTPRLSLDIESGRIWDGLDVRNIRWHDNTLQMSIKHLHGHWDLRSLPWRSLRVSSLHADGVFLEIPDAGEPESIPLFERLNPAQREAITLPDIRLPVDLYLADLRITGIHVKQGDQTNTVDAVALTADMEADLLTLHHFGVTHTLFSAKASGAVTMTGDYPLELRWNADIHEAYQGEPLRVEAVFRNHVSDCRINLRTTGLADIIVAGRIAPLNPSLPMDLKMTWADLTWPPREPFMARSRNGSLRIDGSLDDYRFTAAWELEGEQVPESGWNMIAHGDWRHVVVESLQVDALDGSIAVSGGVEWVTQSNLTAQIRLKDLQLEPWFPQAPLIVSAQANIAAGLAAEGLMLDLNLVAMDAQWNDIPLAVAGDVSYRPHTGWRLDAGRIASRDSEMTLDAAWHERLSASGRVDVADMAVWHPEGQGRLTGSFDVHGMPTAPDFSFRLTGENLGWSDKVSMGLLNLSGDVADMGTSVSSLRLNAETIELPAQGHHAGDLRIALEGTRDEHRLTLGTENGPVDLDILLDGGLDEAMAWTARMQEASVAVAGFDWTLHKHPLLSWDATDKQFIVAAHEWHHGDTRLRFPETIRLGPSGDVVVLLEDLDLKYLAHWAPPEVDVSGLLKAMLTVTWGGDKRPAALLNIAVDEGYATLTGSGVLEDEILHITFETLMLESGIGQEQGWVKLDVIAGDMGSAKVDAAIDIGPDGRLGALDGSLIMESLDLGVALPFIPLLHELEGMINVRFHLAGDIRDPRIDGEIVLSDAAVESVAIPVSLSGINITLTVDGRSGMLEGDLRAGKGKATLSGAADWSDDPWEATFHMQGHDLELAYNAVATLTANPDIKLQLGPDEAIMTGRITIPWAQINVRERPETAVRTSPDVVFSDNDTEEPEEPRPGMLDDWTMTMGVELALGNRVAISGYGLTARLAGNLDVQQAIGGVPQVYGEIRIVDGEYRAYGRRLTVREGRFLFAGPVDQPDIYIEAVREAPAYGVEAGLRVEGRPDDPRMTLFSEPALPEEEALSYLILGRPLTGADDEGVSMLAMAAVSLGVGGGMRLSGVVEEFGIDDVHLDTVGTGKETEVVVSGRVGPRLEIHYGVGVFMPTSRVMMRYRLTRRLFLEAVSSAEDAIDLFYTFSF